MAAQNIHKNTEMTQADFEKLTSEIAKSGATLVAVSKNQTPQAVKKLYDAGQRVFGENRVQELLEKREALAQMGCDEARWHLIGHLQRNKVKYIADFVELIHSVDSLALLQDIDKAARKSARVVDCLLQFHVAQEETKFGLSYSQAVDLLQSSDFAALQNVRIVGIMGMASQTDDAAQIQREFAQLSQYFAELKAAFFADAPYFTVRSMGMSSDFRLALAQGSNMLRIGSLLFA
jgi:pyridoxal phosphate enzyme (YggS family)